MKSIARFILCKILGWKLENDFPKELKKYVVIAAPHTSWLDFPIAILSRVASGTMIHFIGKSSLFSFPFSFLPSVLLVSNEVIFFESAFIFSSHGYKF